MEKLFGNHRDEIDIMYRDEVRVDDDERIKMKK